MLETAAPSEGRAIKLALDVRGWDQQHLSNLTGISQTRLSRCLNGAQRFRPEELRQIWIHLTSEDPR